MEPDNNTNNEAYSCVFCSSTFASHEELKNHFRHHAYDKYGQNESKCKNYRQISVKPSAKTYQRNLNNKMPGRNYVNRTPTECDVCGQMFDCNAAAMTHKFRKHPNSGTHCCPYCGKNFVLKSDFIKHTSEMHTTVITDNNPDLQSLLCSLCTASFFSQTALDFHVKSAHARVVKILYPVVTPPPSKKIRVNAAGEAQSVYFCHLCGSEYVIKYNLRKHLESGHTQEEKNRIPTQLLQCNMCAAMFYSTKAYESHNLTHTDNDLYIKDEKQRLQTVSRVDQDYDASRVTWKLPAGSSGMKYLDRISSIKAHGSSSTIEKFFKNEINRINFEDENDSIKS